MTGNKTDTLSVAATVARNGYQYRCKITNTDGYIVYSAPATLYLMPTVTTAPADQTVTIGDYAIFSVGIDLDDALVTYEWQYSRNSGESWSKTSAAGCDTATLTGIQATANRNGYMYRCKIYGSDGKTYIYTDAVTLTAVS